jgi:hypothetical protein
MELTQPSNRTITHGTYRAIALFTTAVVVFSLGNGLDRNAVARGAVR